MCSATLLTVFPGGVWSLQAASSSIILFWLYHLINRSGAFVRNYFLERHSPGLNAESPFYFQLPSQFVYFHIKQKFKNSCARSVMRRTFPSISKTNPEIPEKQHSYLLTTYLVHGSDSLKTKYKNFERYNCICFTDMKFTFGHWSLYIKVEPTSGCNRIRSLSTGIRIPCVLFGARAVQWQTP
jgi:hypothetical protein